MVELREEQTKAIFHNEGNLLISASAGSGKTFVMISRIIRLITEGKAHVNELMAVTFTEAAATEIKERLKKALSDEFVKTGDTRLIDELNEVSCADISTLHAFCSRLIRIYFYVVGVSPDYKVVDETVTSNIKMLAVENTMRELYTEGDLAFIKFADRYSKKRADSDLKEMIVSLYDYVNSEAHPEEFMQKSLDSYTDNGYNLLLNAVADYVAKEMDNYLDQLRYAERVFKANNLVKGLTFTENLKESVSALSLITSPYELKKFAGFKQSHHASFESKLTGDALYSKTLAVGVRDKTDALINGILQAISTEQADREKNKVLYSHTSTLVKVLSKFAKVYQDLKAEENVLDFADLEHFALKILDDEAINKVVKEKYKYIFVDEYQDVNAVQEELINKIAKDNVFMVGDVKQSIYGFRGCRPEIFANKYEAMNKSGQSTLELNCNFRSSNAVINAVNKVFDFSMTERYFGMDYSAGRLVSGGVFKEGYDGRAELHILHNVLKQERTEEKPRIYNVLNELAEEEEEQIVSASFVAEIIDKELNKTYFSVKDNVEKRVTYSDIVILTKVLNSSSIEKLITGLKKRNIPVCYSSKENIIEYPEIQAMLSVLRICDCFTDNVSLATVLKSPIGKFTDEDLFAVCKLYAEHLKDNADKDSGRWAFTDAYKHALSTQNAYTERLTEFDNYFKHLRLLADFLPAKDIMLKVIEDFSIEAVLSSSHNGKSKANRLNKFIEASYLDGKNYSVKEFIKLANTGKITVADDSSVDAVRLMTIHASKGLEFPVVIVVDASYRLNSREQTEEVLKSREYGLVVKYYDDVLRTSYTTLLRKFIQLKMADDRRKESLRLFYVALTRASYSLNIAFIANKDERKEEYCGGDRFIDFVPLSMPATNYLDEDFIFINQKQEARNILFGTPNESSLNEIKRNLEFVYPYVSDTVLPLKTSVTAINVANEKPRSISVENVSYGAVEEPSVSRAERGTIAHKFMELVDFEKDVYIEKQRIINSAYMTEEEFKQFDLERVSKGIAYVRNLAHGKEAYREKSFILNAPAKMLNGVDSNESVLLQGVIDLLLVDENDAYIVDYKYSSLPSLALKEKYKTQLELYAYAVEKILGLKVKGKQILSLMTGEVVNID